MDLYSLAWQKQKQRWIGVQQVKLFKNRDGNESKRFHKFDGKIEKEC